MTTEAPPLPDLVSTEDYLSAIKVCTLVAPPDNKFSVEWVEWWERRPDAFGQVILQRVVARLKQKLDRHLFGSQPSLATEQQALAFLKAQALELKHAGEELHHAAEAMKRQGGMMMPCNRAHLASKRALAEAAAYLA